MPDCVAIVDEFDEMALDGALNLAKLAKPVRGLDFLIPIHVAIWDMTRSLTARVKYHEPTETYYALNGELKIDDRATAQAASKRGDGKWKPVYAYISDD